jgi:hypothetical protein
MTASGFRYVTFKPLHQEHLPLLSSWLEGSLDHSRQNSSVSFEAFEGQKQAFIEGLIDIDGQKRPLKSFVIFDNQIPCGYTHFYQTTEDEKNGCALAVYFHQSLSDDLERESIFLELFLDNFVFEEYKFCIVDIDTQNTAFLDMFKKIGFKVHTDMNDFVILVKSSNQEE